MLNLVINMMPLIVYHSLPVVSTESDDVDINNWPINNRCKTNFEELMHTHTVIPVPAYSTGGKLVPSTQYEWRLPGVIVQVKFGIVCHYFKSVKCAVFTTVLCNIFILKPAMNIVHTPLK